MVFSNLNNSMTIVQPWENPGKSCSALRHRFGFGIQREAEFAGMTLWVVQGCRYPLGSSMPVQIGPATPN